MAERYAEFDKSRILNFKIRKGEEGVPIVLKFKNEDGSPYDITGKGWELPVKKDPSAKHNFFTLTEGDGLTIQGSDNDELLIEISEERADQRADVNFGRLRSTVQNRTWLNGDWEFIVGKYDGVTETGTITVSDTGDVINITVVSGTGLSIVSFEDIQGNPADNTALVDYIADQITPELFLGYYISLAELETAYPTASEGNWAIVDEGSGEDAVKYIWDSSDSIWVAGGTSGGVQTVVQSNGIIVNNTDPQNPVVSVDDSYFGTAAFEDTTAFDASGAASTVQGNLNTHASNTSNPHGVTKGQVGLPNVDNTSDISKPVSTLQAAADLIAENNAKAYADSLVVNLWDDRGSFSAAGGAYPSSGGSGSAGAILRGDVWTISVAGTLPTGQVVEIGDLVRALVNTPGNTQGNWAITQNNIGYVAENQANKENTTLDNNTTKYPTNNLVKTYTDAALAFKAPLANPAFTGIPTAPTASSGTNTTQLASTAFVQQEIVGLDTDIDYFKIASFRSLYGY